MEGTSKELARGKVKKKEKGGLSANESKRKNHENKWASRNRSHAAEEERQKL